MARLNLSGVVLVAAVALFGFGTLVGVVIAQAASPTAGASISGARDVPPSQIASPVAGTPVSGREELNSVLPDSAGNLLGSETLSDAVVGADRVNVFVEVNTFVGLGTLSTGEHGIPVQEPAARKTEEDEP